MSDEDTITWDISVVTPTLGRPTEVGELLKNLAAQDRLPKEVVLVDGAPPQERATEEVVTRFRDQLPFDVVYMRHQGGTAIQRNAGIDVARGRLIALIDDDVRLEPQFLSTMATLMKDDASRDVGGAVGYRTNYQIDVGDSQRWRWYKKLGLLSIFEPGRYDFRCGYPINNALQPPFTGTRPVDFITTACAVWRREVFESGLRFSAFFKDYGVLEDAHMSLKAGRQWRLLQCGDARCEELHSPNGRVSRRRLGYKCVVNYYFVFRDIVGPLSMSQKFRFWRFQLFDFFRIGASAIRRFRSSDLMDLLGRTQGIVEVAIGRPFKEE